MSYQNDTLDDFVANAAQPIDLTFKVVGPFSEGLQVTALTLEQ